MKATVQGRPTREAGNAKQQELLKIALRHFEEHGVGGANMSDIARDAGMSKATIYRHYVDKHDLFAATVRALSGRAYDMQCLESLYEEERSPEVVLPEVYRQLQDSVVTEIEDIGTGLTFAKTIWSAFPTMHKSRKNTIDLYCKVVINPLAAYLKRWSDNGALTIDDPEMAAWRFCDMGHFSFSLTIRDDIPDQHERERRCRSAVSLFLYGTLSRGEKASG